MYDTRTGEPGGLDRNVTRVDGISFPSLGSHHSFFFSFAVNTPLVGRVSQGSGQDPIRSDQGCVDEWQKSMEAKVGGG